MPLEHVNLARGKDGAAPSSASEKFTAIPDELRVIQEKMKDPVFVELMHEYMQSLEDPETRREEEAYLEQAEREAREGGDFSFEFVFPRPAYVVELLEPSHTRITAAEARQGGVTADATALSAFAARSFLNICHSEKVKAFTEHTTGDAQGSNWEVPVSVSQRRVEVYKAVPASASTTIPAEWANLTPSASAATPLAALCLVHDVVFHPSTLALAERSSKFMCFLTEIAVEHINSGYAESNGFPFRRLPSSVLSIGTPLNQTLRTKHGSTPFQADPKEAVLQGPTKHLPTRASAAAPSLAPQPPNVQPTAAAAAKGKAKAEAEAASRLPPHTITHRGSIDLTDAWRWTVLDRRVGVPEELVVKLTFAEVRRAAALDIAIVDGGHALRVDKTEGQSLYEGLLVLPFTVDEEPRHAQFEKSKGTLTLTLKVVPPPLPDGVVSAAELRRTLPGGVGRTEGAEEEEEETRVDNAKKEEGKEKDEEKTKLTETAVSATAPTEAAHSTSEGADRGEETPRGDVAAPAATLSPSTSTSTSTTAATTVTVTKPEVAHIGNQDRVAAMMEQVAAARAAREAAAAQTQEGEETQQGKTTTTVAAVEKDSKAMERSAEAAVGGVEDAAGSPSVSVDTGVAATQQQTSDADIPFIRKADPAPPSQQQPAVGDSDVDAVRARQQAWAAMVEAEMQVAKAREEAEAAEAARAAEVQAAKARRRLAAEKEQERLEHLAQAKRDTVPLSNKYIFTID